MNKTKKKKTLPPSPYKKRLGLRVFFSLLLIVGAVYIREREPAAASWARMKLSESTDFSAATAFLERHLPRLKETPEGWELTD